MDPLCRTGNVGETPGKAPDVSAKRPPLECEATSWCLCGVLPVCPYRRRQRGGRGKKGSPQRHQDTKGLPGIQPMNPLWRTSNLGMSPGNRPDVSATRSALESRGDVSVSWCLCGVICLSTSTGAELARGGLGLNDRLAQLGRGFKGRRGFGLGGGRGGRRCHPGLSLAWPLGRHPVGCSAALRAPRRRRPRDRRAAGSAGMRWLPAGPAVRHGAVACRRKGSLLYRVCSGP